MTDDFDVYTDLKSGDQLIITGMYRNHKGEKINGRATFIMYQPTYKFGGDSWCIIMAEGRKMPWPLKQVRLG